MTERLISLPMEKIAEFRQKLNVTEPALFGSILRHDFNANIGDVRRSQRFRRRHPVFTTVCTACTAPPSPLCLAAITITLLSLMILMRP
ncbi:hypothetical protein [Roseofilum sp. Guam]|uniref:hypothetical protein n=1 Tax=Roseofilum sp. Guam TaxID=2821502 RepID=UPI000A65B759|nr:hypothetical protein [Roseofilum sp. Guam]